MSDNNGEMTWEILKVDDTYEICKEYPHQIRKRATGRIIKECEDRDGYLRCALNCKLYLKHRLIAIQWIDNPDNLNCVDHINHCRTDNHINNLRWASVADNSNNLVKQTFVDDIPEEAIVVDRYNGHEFEDLYFHDDVFYKYNGINYTIRPKYLNKAGNYRIYSTDVTGKYRTISYNQFKRQYGLI